MLPFSSGVSPATTVTFTDFAGTGKSPYPTSYTTPASDDNGGVFICGTSPSIEPSKANAYTHRTRAGSHLVKDKYLEAELMKVNKNDATTWSSIITNGCSVPHLSFLSPDLKRIIKNLDYVRVVNGGDNYASKMYLVSLQKLFANDVFKAVKDGV